MKTRYESLRAAVVFAGLFFAMAIGHLMAQGTGSISGTVVDTSQATVVGSQVILTNAGTGQARVVTSSGLGFFEFSDLPPGAYKVTVSKSSFKTWEQSAITLAVAQSITLYPMLQVGSAMEHVEVTAEAGFLTTDNASLSGVIDHEQIVEMPLNGRNPLQLEELEPGVVPFGQGGTSGQFGATAVSFASSGGRDIDTNFVLDGGINVEAFESTASPYPNPDALQEFAIVTRNYDARFGRGTTDINAATRAGTNNLHGSLFEFVRNNDFDATQYNPLATGASQTSPYHRNQFGGSLGGPVLKNKVFFFASYQGTQQSGSTGLIGYSTIPTAERGLNGADADFSALSTPIIDPTTGLPFAGNIIPHNRISSQAQTFYSKFLPLPNAANNTYQFLDASTRQEHQGVGRIDYQLSKKDFLFGRYFLEDAPSTGYGNGTGLETNWLSTFPVRYQSITIGEAHTFSPSLLNDFHFTYQRENFGEVTSLPFSLTALGYPVNTQNSFTTQGLGPESGLYVSGAFWVDPGAPTVDIMPTYDTNDNVTWIKGRHTVRAGFQIYNNRINELQNYETGGFMNFSGQWTQSFIGAADFDLGYFSSFNQISGLSARLHQWVPSFYGQDDIKLSRRLTLNAGLRWDIVSGYHSENGQLSTFAPGQQSSVFPLQPEDILYPGDKGVPADVIGTRWDDFAPRVGLALDVFGNGKTSLRAGFGTYFVPDTRGVSMNRQTLNEPFNLNVNVYPNNAQNANVNTIWASPPFNGTDPFPLPASTSGLAKLPYIPGGNYAVLPRNEKTETNYQWSLSVQQAMWWGAVVEAAYVGSSSSHLFTSSQLNPPQPAPGATIANEASRRLYPQFGPIEEDANVLSSNYNALQAVFNLPLHDGLTIKSAFTWAKTLGVASGQESGNYGEGEGLNGPRDPFNYRLGYSRVPFSQPETWATSLIWKAFDNVHFRPVVRPFAAGWEISGIALLDAGTPLTLYSGADNSFTGTGIDTVDLKPGANYHEHNTTRAEKEAHWFNQSAFTQNAPGTFGNFREGTINNPGYINFDANLDKNLAITEKLHMQFRVSLYNAFNHPNLVQPDYTLTDATFGQITGATQARILELGLRLNF